MLSQITPGRVIDERYRLEKLLGSGANGSVYLALETELERKVAIKFLNLNAADASQRFEREAKALSGLLHPNIIRVYRFGFLEDQSPFLVMEYLDGESLRERLERERQLSCAAAVEIAIQIAAGMDYAQSAGIIHRDLKPENIFLCQQAGQAPVAKILDFGLCRTESASELNAHTLTMTGALLGTAHYMSPEQCRGKAVDGRSDIYAFGCLLFEMICGEPPFSGINHAEILLKHLSSPLPRIVDLSPSSKLPQQLQDILLKCCLKNPEDRYANFAELRADLIEIQKLNCTRMFNQAALHGQEKTNSKKLFYYTVFLAMSIIIAAASYIFGTTAGQRQFLAKVQTGLNPSAPIDGMLRLAEQLSGEGKSAELKALIQQSIRSSSFKSWSLIDRQSLLRGYIEICDKAAMGPDSLKLRLKLLSEYMDEVQGKANKMNSPKGGFITGKDIEFITETNLLAKELYTAQHSKKEWSLISSELESKWSLDSTVSGHVELEYLLALRCKARKERGFREEDASELCKLYQFAYSTALGRGDQDLANELFEEEIKIARTFHCYNREASLYSTRALHFLNQHNIEEGKKSLAMAIECAKGHDLSKGERIQIEALAIRCAGGNPDEYFKKHDSRSNDPEVYEVIFGETSKK